LSKRKKKKIPFYLRPTGCCKYPAIHGLSTPHMAAVTPHMAAVTPQAVTPSPGWLLVPHWLLFPPQVQPSTPSHKPTKTDARNTKQSRFLKLHFLPFILFFFLEK
jgi:hypothetical protein